MKSPVCIRTYEVLAAWDALPMGELRQSDIAAHLGVPASRISGHLDWLRKCGKIERVSRGVYRRTAFGGRSA